MLYRQLWSDLIEHLRLTYPEMDSPNPSGKNWIRFTMADSRGVLSYAPKQKKLSLYLLFRGDKPENWFQYIKSYSKNFEEEVGYSFEWKSSDDGPGYGLLTFDFDHLNVDGHSESFNMIGKLLYRLTDALSKRHEKFLKDF